MEKIHDLCDIFSELRIGDRFMQVSDGDGRGCDYLVKGREVEVLAVKTNSDTGAVKLFFTGNCGGHTSKNFVGKEVVVQIIRSSNPRLMGTVAGAVTGVLDFFRNKSLQEGDRLLLKYGLENPTGVPTEEGLKLLQAMQWAEKREAVIAVAKEKDEAEKEAAKKA